MAIALGLALAGCSGGTAAPVPETTSAKTDLTRYIGKPGGSTAMTVEQGRDFLEKASKIHPDFAAPRTLQDARNTCSAIRNGVPDLTGQTVKRFSGGERNVTPAMAEQLVKLVKENGFCKA